MKRALPIFVAILAIFSTAYILNAQRVITGRVTDAETGDGLPGVTVVVKGTSVGVRTDTDGRYRIEAPAGSNTLIFRYTGFETAEVALGASDVVDVALRSTSLMTQELVVVGSRNLTRTKTSTPVPVDVIPITNLVNEVGQIDLNQLLTYVAPSFQSARQTIADGTDHVDPAQLRGLGPDQILVLINGKRRHQSALVNVNGTVNRGTVGTDLSAIPANAIERIEILRDGAAAQYGSDAIAGIINIVLKRQTGLSANILYGQHITTFEKNYALWREGKVSDPNVSVSDGQNAQVGLNYGIKVGSKGFLNLTGEYTFRGETNRAGTYTGQIYPRNAANQIVDDSILAARGLTREFFDMRIGNSRIESGGVMANFEMPLTSAWSIYAFGGYNRKAGNAAGFYRYPNAIVVNAKKYAPNVLAVYPNGFLPEIQSGITDFSIAVGARGKLGRWDVDLSNTLGQNVFNFTVQNSVNYTQAAVSPNNLQTKFDAGGLSFLQNTTNLDLSRKFSVLQGLNVAFGAEHRIDQFGIRAGEEASYRNYDVSSGAVGGAQVFAGFLPSNEGTNSRNAIGLYADFEQDFNEAFMVSIAGRFENYSDFGSTLNYKVASRYRFGDFLTIRASTSTGFRAPSMQQRFYAKTNTLFVSTPGGLVPVESGTFPNGSRPAEILGIPKLKQETSVNYALGITARPLRGLEITLDAYQIDITDRIVLTNNFTDGGDSVLRAQLQAANASQANFFTNAIDTRSRGIEAVIAYQTRLGTKQDIRFSLAGTWIDNEVKKDANGKPIIKASPVLERTGQIGRYFNREDQSRIEVANPRNKITGIINYRYDKFNVMLRGVYFGDVVYLDPTIDPNNPNSFPSNAFNDGKKETLDQTFKGKTIFDLSLGYDITPKIGITLGANNLFDTYQDRHTHSGNMSLGRFVFSRRVQQFGFNGRFVFARLRFNL
ncbi:MAG: TonB-dependent receptor [Saprospiraceae bacterium]|nr:TonB-dependent receptor [Saprospiraceae bacterium]MDW8483337.1 TonB-dependent receptor [Saprospiraceae bacterium]